MPKTSAGILMYHIRPGGGFEVLLVHPGGPYWKNKDSGAWSVPKGEYSASAGEDPLMVAKREFEEETGFRAHGEFKELGSLRQPGGKLVTCWALEGGIDADKVRSNTFSIEWPPRLGQQADFPEVDRAGWFSAGEARAKILKGQAGFIDRLCQILGQPSGKQHVS